jgi:hypothetical protein
MRQVHKTLEEHHKIHGALSSKIESGVQGLAAFKEEQQENLAKKFQILDLCVKDL